MALLEQVNALKQQGLGDAQIVNTLKEEGNSPMDINEAISQSRIKAAVSNEAQSNQQNDLQPSMMAGNSGDAQYMSVPESAPGTPAATTQIQAYSQMYSQEAAQPQQAPQFNPQEAQQAYPQEQAQYADQGQYAQQAYGQQYADQGYYPQAMDIETVRDVSKQQTEESLKKIRLEIDSLSKMRSELKFEITDMQSRLSQVEAVIHEIQSAVIRKMGEYGEAIAGISQEVKATQNSFAKVINPLMDKKRGLSQESPEESESPQKSKSKKSSKPEPKVNARAENSESFEDYFR